MAIPATYATSSSFLVSSDVAPQFAAGMRVLADCGTDGLRYGTVASVASTTVSLTMDAGNALTTNLTGVLHGNDTPNSLVNHGHTGPADGGLLASGLIDTRVTTGQTMEAGHRYRGFLSSAQSFPLPSSPADGATVTYLDAGRNSATYNATLGRNGKTINGVAEDFVVDENGAEITLAYDSTTGDWSVTLNIPGNN